MAPAGHGSCSGTGVTTAALVREAPSTLLGGRFLPGRLLRVGQSARILQGKDVHSGEPVALKLLRTPCTARRLQRFRREAELCARLDHPGLLRALGAGVEGEQAWIAFELLHDATSLEGGPRFGLRWWVDVIRDAALAVGSAHQKGIVHRDLRNESILVDGRGKVRVVDFSQAAVGVEPRIDVWSLAAILREGLVGTAIPFRLERLLERALSHDLLDRPPTGLALAGELEAAL